MIPKFRVWEESAEEDLQMWSWKEMCEMDLGQFFNNPKYELMQYTGLKDKNGVEIYEGDIVQMQWTIYDKPELFYIRTIEGRAPRVDNRIKGKELWLVHQDCKVVGNIYQNRELLEVAE